MKRLTIGFLGDHPLGTMLLSDVMEYGHRTLMLDYHDGELTIVTHALDVLITTENRHTELLRLEAQAATTLVITSNKELITCYDSLLKQDIVSLYVIQRDQGGYLCGEIDHRLKAYQNEETLTQLQRCINSSIISLSRGVLPNKIIQQSALAHKFYANTALKGDGYYKISTLIPLLLQRLGDQTAGHCATNFRFINWKKNAYFYTLKSEQIDEERHVLCHFFYDETGARQQNGYLQSNVLISLARSDAGVMLTITGDDRRFRRFTHYLDALLLTEGNPLIAPLVIAEEEIRQLSRFNDTTDINLLALDLIESFRLIAKEDPQLPALYVNDGYHTYGEINEQSDQMAYWLIQNAGNKSPIVAVCLQKSALLIVILLGILKSGKTYLLLDPWAPSARNQAILDDAQPGIILSDLPLSAASAPCIHPEKIHFRRLIVDPNSMPSHSSELAYICYTSGTTGKPKGVMITRTGLNNVIHHYRAFLPLKRGSRVLSIASVGFDAFGWDLYGALISGATLYLTPHALHTAVDALHHYLTTHAIDHITVTSALLELLPRKPWPGLQSIIVMGDTLAAETAAWWAKQIRLYNGYGPTEATIAASFFEYPARSLWNTIGKPLKNYRCYVLDTHHNELPVGFEGELCIAGVGLAKGYLQQPALTREKFVEIQLPSGIERIYKTGDLAKWDEHGNLIFIGRKDDQIKIRGVRIEPGEVEAAIRSHPDVRHVYVVSNASPLGRVLVAFVQPTSCVLTENSLRNTLSTLLHPAAIPTTFIFLSSMPLTINGKIDRKQLEEWQVVPSKDAIAQPETPAEAALARIVATAIGCSPVDVTKDFISLGAHSLTMSAIVALVARDLHCPLNIADLFHYNTTRKLATHIESQAPLTEKEIKRGAERQALLTPQQNLLWYLSALSPNDCSYNLPTVIAIRGALDLTILEQAINFIYEKHESLRTQFGEQQGVAYQYVVPHAPLKLAEYVLNRPEASMEDLVGQLCAQPFDITHGPPVRMRLIHYHKQHHLLLFIKHNIITDAWSEGLILNDLWQHYNALYLGVAATPPPAQVQTVDIVNNRVAVMHPHDRSYWKEKLQAVTELNLPLDYPRPLVMTHAGRQIHYPISRIAASLLAKCAKAFSTTPFVLLITVLKYLLSKYANQQEIVIGTAISARDSLPLRNISGFYVNTVPLRTHLDARNTLASFVNKVTATCVGAYQHQGLSFDQMLREVHYERLPNKNPLFQIMAILQNAGEHCQTAPHGCQVEMLQVNSGYAMFDMTWNFTITANEITIRLNYSSELFHADTVRRMLSNYEQALHALLITCPTMLFTQIDYLSDKEKQRIRHLGTNKHRSQRGTLLEQIGHIAENQPELPAVSCDHDALSYGQLWALSDRIACRLNVLKPGACSVGLIMEKSCKVAALILGILKAGKYYIPIDHHYPPERLRYLIENSRLSLLVTDHASRVNPSNFPITHYEELAAFRAGSGNGAPNIQGDTLAYLMYTSGSTGDPKGVMITHDNLNNIINCFADQLALSSHDRMLSLTSISFDIFGLELFCSLVSGTPVTLCSREVVMDPVQLFHFIRNVQPTIMQATPTLWGSIAGHLPTASTQQLTLLCGGEKMPATLLAQLRRISTRLIQVYGPTETTIWSTMADLTLKGNSECIGKPIDLTAAFILDADDHPLPTGAYGELYLGGSGVSPGYWDKPPLTHQSFITHEVLGSQHRLYKTGDIVRFNCQGDLEYLGRNDHQIKIRGHRIELNEIDLILSSLDNVVRAMSLIRGEGNSARIISYLQLVEGTQLNEQQVRALLRARLPNIMIPAGFVVLPLFPVTPNDKIDIRKLPTPAVTDALSEENYIPPAIPEEQDMQKIWQTVLAQQRISVTDSFFNLGGNSLQIPRLLHEIQEKMQVSLTIREFILNGQIRDLTALVLTKIKGDSHGIH